MTEPKLESGIVGNTVQETRTMKNKDGSKTVESVKLNTDTGELLSHTIDGKEVEKETKDKPTPTAKVTYQQSNFEPLLIILLNKILNQLAETNYYLKQHFDKENEYSTKEVRNHIKEKRSWE